MKGIINLIMGVFLNPKESFKSIAEKPRVLVPWLIFAIISVAGAWLSLPAIQQMSVKALEKSGQTFSPEQLGSMIIWVTASTILAAIFMPLVISLPQAALLKLYSSFTVSGGTFKQFLSIALYSGLPSLLGGLLKGLLMFFLKPANPMAIQTSLAILVPLEQLTSPFYLFLAQIDFFILWGLILFALGSSVVLEQHPKKVGGFVFIIWLVYAVAMSFLGAANAAKV